MVDVVALSMETKGCGFFGSEYEPGFAVQVQCGLVPGFDAKAAPLHLPLLAGPLRTMVEQFLSEALSAEFGKQVHAVDQGQGTVFILAASQSAHADQMVGLPESV